MTNFRHPVRIEGLFERIDSANDHDADSEGDSKQAGPVVPLEDGAGLRAQLELAGRGKHVGQR